MRWLAIFLMLLAGSLLTTIAVAQQPADPEPGAGVCTFADGKELTVRYNRVAADPKKDLPGGKLWMPGGDPMNLFTETDLVVNNIQIPVGAYRMYVIPAKDNWTVIINKNVVAGSAYDEKQDLVRVQMPTGKLPQAEPQLNIYLGHIAPKRCEMRVDFGKTRADGLEFNEK
jgi:DUF2911 family protein